MRMTATIAMELALSTSPAVPAVELEKTIILLPKLAEKSVIIAMEQEKLDVANVEEMAILYASIVVGIAHHSVLCVMAMV